MLPSLSKLPPTGSLWLHEIKFDGFRAQVHLNAGEITIYSRNGADFTRRFQLLKPAIARIHAKNAVIDCEVVAVGPEGKPDFRALMDGSAALCLWCFDLLALNGERLTDRPLKFRRARLAKLLEGAHSDALQFSGDFPDPVALLEAADGMGLEGIVSKRRDSLYRSGPTKLWVKVKTAAWRQANRDRWEMFER